MIFECFAPRGRTDLGETLESTRVIEDLRIAHIVMVDDDKDDVFLTKKSFEKADYPFKFTGLSGAQKLFDFIETEGLDDIDIILLDLNMPVIGGLEALKKLRALPEIETVKIFMFSSSSRHEDRNQCVEAGADGYLYKPSQADDVKRSVNTICLASNVWISR